MILIIESKEEKEIFEEFKNLRFCGTDLIKHEIKFFSNSIKSAKIRHLSTEYRPIRIFLETTHFEKEASKSSFFKDKISLIKGALNKAIKAFESLLEVEDVNDPNLFNNVTSAFSYYKIESWSDVFNKGGDIKSDFIVVVTFSDNALASSFPIMQDKNTKRPIVGLLKLSIDEKMYSYKRAEEYLSEVFLHELTHALGFLDTMFQYYQYGLNKTLTTKKIRGKNRTLIITPKVVEHAKKYFNCSTLTGVELENQGGDGISGSHWEQRILLGEYMGALIYQEEMVISEFTLAALEDSGWYKANYYTGGLMKFGKNQGCEFLENDCRNSNSLGLTAFENEFFNYRKDADSKPSCTAGRQSRAYSKLSVYLEIDKEYSNHFVRYFDKLFFSTDIYTTDYCFVHTRIPQEDKQSFFTGNCKLGNGDYGEFIDYINDQGKKEEKHPNSVFPKELGETYSNTSFCFMSSLVPSVPSGNYSLYGSIFHSMCYQVHCSSKSLTIQINDDYIVCPRQGGNVQVKGYNGLLNCPDYNLICTGTVLCNDMFDCINKKSVAKNETYYYDYISLTTQNYEKLINVQNLSAYELSDDGICPLYCSQCSKNKECKKCLDGYKVVQIIKDGITQEICEKFNESDSSDSSNSESKLNFNLLLIILIVIIILVIAGIGIGIFIFIRHKNKNSPEKEIETLEKIN